MQALTSSFGRHVELKGHFSIVDKGLGLLIRRHIAIGRFGRREKRRLAGRSADIATKPAHKIVILDLKQSVRHAIAHCCVWYLLSVGPYYRLPWHRPVREEGANVLIECRVDIRSGSGGER